MAAGIGWIAHAVMARIFLKDYQVFEKTSQKTNDVTQSKDNIPIDKQAFLNTKSPFKSNQSITLQSKGFVHFKNAVQRQ